MLGWKEDEIGPGREINETAPVTKLAGVARLAAWKLDEGAKLVPGSLVLRVSFRDMAVGAGAGFRLRLGTPLESKIIHTS